MTSGTPDTDHPPVGLAGAHHSLAYRGASARELVDCAGRLSRRASVAGTDDHGGRDHSPGVGVHRFASGPFSGFYAQPRGSPGIPSRFRGQRYAGAQSSRRVLGLAAVAALAGRRRLRGPSAPTMCCSPGRSTTCSTAAWPTPWPNCTNPFSTRSWPWSRCTWRRCFTTNGSESSDSFGLWWWEKPPGARARGGRSRCSKRWPWPLRWPLRCGG